MNFNIFAGLPLGVFFFSVLLSQFKFTQLKHTRKTSYQNMWRAVQWGGFYLCAGMEERSNLKQQNTCQVGQQTVDKGILAHWEGGAWVVVLFRGGWQEPNTSGSCCSQHEAVSHSHAAQQLAGSVSFFLPLPGCSQHSNKDPDYGLKFRADWSTCPGWCLCVLLQSML